MTERVDLDRLADYIGGALDGTPDAAEVRRLVDTHPEWASAHEDLAAAMLSVSAGLNALGSQDSHVPEAVVTRWENALHLLGSSHEAASASRGTEAAFGGPGAAVDGARGAATTSHPTDAAGRPTDRSADFVRPGGERRGPGGTGPGRERKRRTARWAAGLSAAAAVIAFGIGVVATFPTDRSETAADNAAGAPGPAEAMASPAAGAPGTVSSGRDYRAGSFEGLSDGAAAPYTETDRSARSGVKADQLPQVAAAPPELARFQSPAAVQACLDAIRRMFGGSAQVVDLARYEGDPAVVVLLNGAAAGNGRPLVVVAGPGCGLVPGDVDEVFHGPLA